MSESISAQEDFQNTTIADSKPISKGAQEHAHYFRILRASIWKLKKREASPLILGLLSILMNMFASSTANADPAEVIQLAKRKNSSRLKLQKMLESSDSDLEPYTSQKDKDYPIDSDLPPPPIPFKVNFWQNPENNKSHTEIDFNSLQRIDLTDHYQSEAFRTHKERSIINELSIDLHHDLPLEIVWEKVGNLVENSVDKLDTVWKKHHGRDFKERHAQPESEEIDLWKSFNRELGDFLTPKLRLSSNGVTLVNSWEWNDKFSLSVKSQFTINETVLKSIKAKAEFREEILGGLLRIIARYRFRPSKKDSGSLEARYEYSFADECHGYLSASTNINGESILQCGFTLTFGGTNTSKERSSKYRESRRYRRTAGQRARSKLKPERALTKLAVKAQKRAKKDN